MAIDRDRIINELSKLEVKGDETGLILSFGVFVQQLPSMIWTQFSERLTRAVPKELVETAEWLLVNAAHECGYHTGYGIITSEDGKYLKGTSENSKIKACDRAKSGVYTEVNEHFGSVA